MGGMRKDSLHVRDGRLEALDEGLLASQFLAEDANVTSLQRIADEAVIHRHLLSQLPDQLAAVHCDSCRLRSAACSCHALQGACLYNEHWHAGDVQDPVQSGVRTQEHFDRVECKKTALGHAQSSMGLGGHTSS